MIDFLFNASLLMHLLINRKEKVIVKLASPTFDRILAYHTEIHWSQRLNEDQKRKILSKKEIVEKIS
ncbi:putative uncharacterized protein [Parachlamydia acanthamoebae UV-7]|jgi:hypothetical protein|uniref:Uncharacterized protein n=1 Tax=Parachlamydia acanthamoebae (strain UV7) TaxID=765952 RepID=F8L250_PARAV|nr:hypothetical protein pah_c047o050 [Parachlamydia acanthamoebae str. Hall's coccus]CCB87377.1 putative uncharacterized protein [Parachlamydia acanthamoebae UV-7]